MFSGNITIWWATKFILWSGDLTFLPSWSRTFGHFGPRPNDHYIIGLILRNFGVTNFMVYLYTDTWAFGLSPFDMSPEILPGTLPEILPKKTVHDCTTLRSNVWSPYRQIRKFNDKWVFFSGLISCSHRLSNSWLQFLPPMWQYIWHQ